MHRLVLENNFGRGRNRDGESEIETTPIRGSLVNPSPRRLLLFDFEPVSRVNNFFQETTSLSAILSKTINSRNNSAFYTATTIPFQFGGNQDSARTKFKLPVASQNRNVSGDRFIPRRRGVNFDLSHYYHTHIVDEEKQNDDYLDVFQEIKNATERWRRKYMDNAFEYLNIFPGLQSKRVLNIGESSSSSSPSIDLKRSGQTRESSDDCHWNCRPRRQPLMNMKRENSKRYRDYGAQIFRFAMAIKIKNVIDWGSKNLLATGLADTMCICDVDFKYLAKVYRIDHTSYLCCIKWSAAGTRVSMSGIDGSTALYDIGIVKIVWTRYCPNFDAHSRKCKVTCSLWARNDRELINGCSEGCLSTIDSSNGTVLNTISFNKEVLAVSMSPKEQYLAVSSADRLVKLFDYPSMLQLFEIAFFASVKAMAWHPWSSGILCIGGGPGDGSLSLWNVNAQRQLAFRKIKFVGAVDSLMFNKLSAELLVHWFYLENDQLRSKIAVLAALDRIVDAVPIMPEHRMLNLVWSPDHTKLAMQHRDTLVIWNFFGNEYAKWSKVKKTEAIRESKNNLRNYSFDAQPSSGPYTALENARRGKDFTYYNIR